MNYQEIINRISELADELGRDNASLTRSDLAWELKDLGVDKDSPEISKFVWDCLKMTGNQNLAKVFLSNDKNSSLIDEYQIPALIEDGKNDSVFDTIKEKLGKSGSILGALEGLVSEKQKIQMMEKTSQILDTVSGTGAVNKIQQEAELVFKQYSQLANHYGEAKSSVKNITKDFCEIRQKSADMYRRYAITLQDIFGDKIKASVPELFNFDTIEFLDVEAMLKNVELNYNSIFGKCGELAGTISDSFSSTLKLSASQYSKQADKRVGLALAGINMISHYIKANQQTSALRKDVQELKMSIGHDIAAIRTDEIRLAEVYKILNDVYIPKAEIFAKSAPAVFDDEIEMLVNTMYSLPEAKQLKAQRDAILDEIRTLERRITDEQMSINYYAGHITDCKQTLSSLDEQYKKAKADKPEEPSGLSNIFSLGSAKKQYERDIYNWSKNCEPLISKYEDMIVDVKVDGEELENQKNAYIADKKRYDELKQQQKMVSDKLSAMLNADPMVKEKVASRLDDIIKLLQIAKDITTSKLYDRLAKVVQVKKFSEIELPENISKAIKDFKGSLADSAKFTEQDARNIGGSKMSAEDTAMLTAQGNEVLQKSLGLCNQLAELEAIKLNYTLSQEHYEKEFNKIKEQFVANMKLIDNQSAALQEIARMVNTADNNEAVKRGLLKLLGDGHEQLSAQDWNDFLEGRKTITI